MKLKKHKLQILCLFLVTLTIMFQSSCTKDSINGYLDGRWQIMEIEKEGDTEYLKDEQLYYNFYMHVVNLSSYGFLFTDGNMRFENNTLHLDFPYVDTAEGMDRLNLYGIYTNPVTFSVEHLSKNKLILKEGDVTITLRKF